MITIDEAIKIKEEDLKRRRVYYNPNLLEADRLSIKALKLWKERHDRCPDDINFLLPRETED